MGLIHQGKMVQLVRCNSLKKKERGICLILDVVNVSVANNYIIHKLF